MYEHRNIHAKKVTKQKYLPYGTPDTAWIMERERKRAREKESKKENKEENKKESKKEST